MKRHFVCVGSSRPIGLIIMYFQKIDCLFGTGGVILAALSGPRATAHNISRILSHSLHLNASHRLVHNHRRLGSANAFPSDWHLCDGIGQEADRVDTNEGNHHLVLQGPSDQKFGKLHLCSGESRKILPAVHECMDARSCR